MCERMELRTSGVDDCQVLMVEWLNFGMFAIPSSFPPKRFIVVIE